MAKAIPDGKASPSAETLGNSPISLFLYVPDADAAFKKAVAAGAEAFFAQWAREHK